MACCSTTPKHSPNRKRLDPAAGAPIHTLVTGGAGFIGSTLVDALLAAGHRVDVVDNLTTGSLSNLDDARHFGDALSFAELDIRDRELVSYVAHRAPDVVIHLAAQASVTESVDDPVTDADVNVIGTLQVLEGARRAGASKVLFATSAAIYGDVDASELPINEDRAYDPQSPYGISKMAALSYLDNYRRLHGLSWTALALANVYGPRQNHHGEAGVIARFAAKVTAGAPPTIFGDGNQTRDFVFVGDVARAFIAAMTAGSNRVINIGTGIGVSINELLGAMNVYRDRPLAPIIAPERPGDLRASRLDATLAKRELDWEATTSLAEGLRQLLGR